MSDVVVRTGPRPLGAAIAVGCGALAVGQLGSESIVRTGLAGQLLAIVALYVGAERLRAGHRVTGGLLSVTALVAIMGAAPALASVLGRPDTGLDVVPGVVGVAVLGVGVTPLASGGSRWLVKIGTGLVFLAALLATLLNEVGLGVALGVVVLTVVAWDAGETAINVGRQVGREAEAWRVQLLHVGATAVVGVVGIAITRLVESFGGGSLSLSRFTAFVVAIVLLAAALHD